VVRAAHFLRFRERALFQESAIEAFARPDVEERALRHVQVIEQVAETLVVGAEAVNCRPDLSVRPLHVLEEIAKNGADLHPQSLMMFVGWKRRNDVGLRFPTMTCPAGRGRVDLFDFRNVVVIDAGGHPHHDSRGRLPRLRVRWKIELLWIAWQRGVAVIAADAQGLREAAHRGDQFVSGDVLRQDLQIVEMQIVGAGRLGLLLIDGGATDDEDGERGSGGEFYKSCHAKK